VRSMIRSIDQAFALAYPKGDPGRWFMESPVHDEGRTWIVTKMWGRNTEPVRGVEPASVTVRRFTDGFKISNRSHELQ
jgi:hypothetical protein